MPPELWQWPAAALAGAIRAKRISPVEATAAILDHIAEQQPRLNCFITVCADEALAQARAAETALMRGDPLGALHGVPFSVKDIVNTQGVPTTFGALPLRHNIPDQDAVAVARLRDAGAILIGKTTTPEFGSKGFTDAPLFGATRNAWSARHTCGGSSGAMPAACNGVVGIKQTIGVVPHSQALDLFGNQTYVTPTTRTVLDTALMLDAMAGPHACDPWSLGRPRVDYAQAVRAARDLRGKRFRYNLTPHGRRVSAQVEQVFRQALRHIESLGGSVEPFEAELDIEPLWRTVNHTVWRARFAPLVQQHGAALSATFRRQIESAQDYSALDYQNAMFARSRLFHTVQGWLDGADFLVMPTLTRTALPLGTDIFDRMEIDGVQLDDIRANWYPWTMPFNMTGHPAISLPCGFDAERLPVGLQIVAPLFADAQMLQAAACLETSFNLLQAWPDMRSTQDLETPL